MSRRRVLSEIDAQYQNHECSVDDVLRLLQLIYVISMEKSDGELTLRVGFDQ